MSQYNYQNVIAVLSMRSKVLEWTGHEERIKEICSYAAVMSASDAYWRIVEDEEVEFQNGMLRMSPDTARILRIRTLAHQRIRHKVANATSAQILDYSNGTVLVDSWKIPYTDEGVPDMNMWQIEYAADCCEYYLIRDAWMEGKLSRIDLDQFERKMGRSLKVATKFRPSVDDMEKAMLMMRCGIFFPNADVLKTM